MKNLIRNILKENDWDWVRSIPTELSFSEVSYGDWVSVSIKDEGILRTVLRNCDSLYENELDAVVEQMSNAELRVNGKEFLDRDSVICGCEEEYGDEYGDEYCDEKVLSISLDPTSLGGNSIFTSLTNFWVTEEMLYIYEESN